MIEPTSLASWTRALRKQLDALGLDSGALCLQAGLDPQLMDDPNARYPLSATTRLWELAVQVSGDPAFVELFGKNAQSLAIYHHHHDHAHDLHGAVVDDPTAPHTHVHGDSCKHG